LSQVQWRISAGAAVAAREAAAARASELEALLGHIEAEVCYMYLCPSVQGIDKV